MALFKNKETDKKRKGENVIGKIIYGFLLFAPLMSILFTSLYTVFNKNAFESYYGETINEKIYQPITDKNQLNINSRYNLELHQMTISTQVGESRFRIYFDIINVNENTSTVDVSTAKSIGFFASSNILVSYFYDENNTELGRIYSNNNVLLNMDITYLSNNLDNNNPLQYNILTQITYNKYSYLDNSFEYGMYKTEQSNIYNWSKTTGTYTVMQNVCTGIGITNTFVPMLMAYWLIISIIYFIFDIALILIWAVHDKIHELKESI